MYRSRSSWSCGAIFEYYINTTQKSSVNNRGWSLEVCRKLQKKPCKMYILWGNAVFLKLYLKLEVNLNIPVYCQDILQETCKNDAKTKDIICAIDIKEYCATVFVVLAKAFDSVARCMLLDRLKDTGLRESYLWRCSSRIRAGSNFTLTLHMLQVTLV